MTEAVKATYTPQEIRAKLEAEAPDMLKMIDDIRREFPGAKVPYVKCGDMEIGEKPQASGESVEYDARQVAKLATKAARDREVIRLSLIVGRPHAQEVERRSREIIKELEELRRS